MYSLHLAKEDDASTQTGRRDGESLGRIDASGSDLTKGGKGVDVSDELDAMDASIGETMDTLLLRSKVDRDAMNVVVSNTDMSQTDEVLETYISNNEEIDLEGESDFPSVVESIMTIESAFRKISRMTAVRDEIKSSRVISKNQARIVKQSYGSLGPKLSLERFTDEPSSVSFTNIISFMDSEVESAGDSVYVRLQKLCEEVIPKEKEGWMLHVDTQVASMRGAVSRNIEFANTMQDRDLSGFFNGKAAFATSIDLSLPENQTNITIESDRLVNSMTIESKDVDMIESSMRSPVVRTFFFDNVSEGKTDCVNACNIDLIESMMKLDVLIKNVMSTRSISNVESVRTYMSDIVSKMENLMDNYTELRGKDNPTDGWEAVSERLNKLVEMMDRMNTILGIGHNFVLAVDNVCEVLRMLADANES